LGLERKKKELLQLTRVIVVTAVVRRDKDKNKNIAKG
jgi:hypothetical protein